MSLERILETLKEGLVLETPSGRAKFIIQRLNGEGVEITVGAGLPILLPRNLWDSLASFLEGKGWVRIGSIHGKAEKGTLDYFVQQFTNGRSAASYIAPILEKAGLVEISRSQPSRLRYLPNSLTS